jgi:hypothetical protein
VQIGNALLVKRQMWRTIEASPYLCISPAEHLPAAALYPWLLIRPFLTRDDTASRLIADLGNHFNRQEDTLWAMALLQLLKDTVQPVVVFEERPTAAVVLPAAAATCETASWSNDVMSLWVLLVALKAACTRLQALYEVSQYHF